MEDIFKGYYNVVSEQKRMEESRLVRFKYSPRKGDASLSTWIEITEKL